MKVAFQNRKHEEIRNRLHSSTVCYCFE